MDPETLRKHADDLDRKAAESFERSDTDGFLSQAACNSQAMKLRMEADLLEAGGLAEFPGLYTKAGRRLNARLIYTNSPYSRSAWLLADEEVLIFDRRFVPFAGHGGRSRIQARLGLEERVEMAPAGVYMGDDWRPHLFRKTRQEARQMAERGVKGSTEFSQEEEADFNKAADRNLTAEDGYLG